MSIRTTVTLDDDVVERVKRESRARGASFRDTLNDLLRFALLTASTKTAKPKLRIRPVHMGYRAGLNHDDISALLEYGEGPEYR